MLCFLATWATMFYVVICSKVCIMWIAFQSYKSVHILATWCPFSRLLEPVIYICSESQTYGHWIKMILSIISTLDFIILRGEQGRTLIQSKDQFFSQNFGSPRTSEGSLSHNNWAAMKNNDIYGLYGLHRHAVLLAKKLWKSINERILLQWFLEMLSIENGQQRFTWMPALTKLPGQSQNVQYPLSLVSMET